MIGKISPQNAARRCGKRSLLLLFFILMPIIQANAQYTRLPVIPAAVYNVSDYGAVGDNSTLNTAAIQKALDMASVSGGKVVIPPGEYLCGPLKLYSKTELEIDKGATLRLINDIDNYPVSGSRCLNFIDVSKATDIKLSGAGTIDGQGAPWWRRVEDNSLKNRRPQMLYIEGTERIEISGITFLNPPNTHISLKNTRDVYIHNIVIQAPANSHNTDGINISARNCTIEHCNISTGDDNIAVNFGNRNQPADDPEVQNIDIHDCTFGYGHGLSIGSFTSGGLNNMHVNNCTFDGTTSAIRIKTARGRGGLIQHISYENISIKNSRYPISISAYYPKEPKAPQDDATTTAGAYCPVYKDISLKNINATDCQQAMLVWGVPESPIQTLRLENVTISAAKGAVVYNTQMAEFINVTINNNSGDKLTTYNAYITGSK